MTLFFLFFFCLKKINCAVKDIDGGPKGENIKK